MVVEVSITEETGVIEEARSECNPYVGPRPFERVEQRLFFGRDWEAAKMAALMITHPVVLLYAESGAGKSSLLNARVLPALEAAEGCELLPVARVRGDIPPEVQSAGIKNLYIFNTLVSWSETIGLTPAQCAELSLPEFLRQLPHQNDHEGYPALRIAIFDQFEELFAFYPERWSEREEFFIQINQALADDSLLRVLLVIREDYLAQLDPYAPILPEQLRARFRLERLRQEAALAAVVGPLRGTGRSFAPGVAKELVTELLKIRIEDRGGTTTEAPGEFVEPVQLQVVCQSLWTSLPPEVIVINQNHLPSGNVDRALTEYYERTARQTVQQTTKLPATIARLIPPYRVWNEWKLRGWFERHLVTASGTRSLVYRDAKTKKTGGISDASIKILEDHHLIRGEQRAGAQWYELTHDRFIWPIQKSNADWHRAMRQKWEPIVWGVVGLVVVILFAIASFNAQAAQEAENAQASAEATVQAVATENARNAATAQAAGTAQIRGEATIGAIATARVEATVAFTLTTTSLIATITPIHEGTLVEATAAQQTANAQFESTVQAALTATAAAALSATATPTFERLPAQATADQQTAAAQLESTIRAALTATAAAALPATATPTFERLPAQATADQQTAVAQLESTVRAAQTATAAAALPATATPTPEKPPISGKLAFSVDDGSGKYDVLIYSIPDGASLEKIAGARQPNFRFDGARLLVNGERGNFGQSIYEVNLLGDKVPKMVGNLNDDLDSYPVYNPAGDRVAYSNPVSAFYSFIFMQCDLTPPSEARDKRCQNISEDGMLFTKFNGVVHNIEGKYPVWTNDDRIAYTGCNNWNGSGKCGIYIVPSWAIKRESSSYDNPPDNIIDTGINNIPTDSKAGLIAFQSLESDNWEVYITDLEGNKLNISNSVNSSDGLPTISPDGGWVAFASDREGIWAVYVAPISGGQVQKLFDFPKINPWGTGDRDWTNERMSWGP